MIQYLDMIYHILKHGKDKENRTGIKTKSVFGYTMRFNLSDGFPALTTKKLAFKSVVSELLWMLEGSNDERRLAEILYGVRDDRKTIWSDNANADFWIPKAKFDGDLGRIYGVQWRSWEKITILEEYDYGNNDKIIPRDICTIGNTIPNAKVRVEHIDQIKDIVYKLKHEPNDRRIILSAWNVSDIGKMALPPCHLLSQYYVSDNKLSSILYQRSCDVGLGVPFNIASYALFTSMLAKICGYDVGEFIWFGADVHIYHDHIDTLYEQLKRNPLKLPKLWLNPDIKDIFSFTMDDIKLLEYHYHGPLKMKMAV